MRVLHVSAGNLFGGVESLLVTLTRYRELCPAMEPHFACCFDGRFAEELRQHQVPLHLLGPVRISRPWTVWKARSRFRKLLAEGDFQVVVCHSTWAQVVFGGAARRAGMTSVFWLHDAVSGRQWLEQVARWSIPHFAICNSRYTASLLPALYPSVRFDVLACPVGMKPANPPADRQALREEFLTPPDAVVILQASRLEPWKGHLHLARALTHLKEEPNWVWWVAGGAQRPVEEAYLAELRSLLEQYGIADRVRFLGHRSDVPRLMEAADLYCQPNAAPEPFGIAFIEALGARLPVVTTAFGGALEIVDDTCGLLVPPGDHQALADALRRLIRDPAYRHTLGQAGPERAKDLCDPATQLHRLSDMLERASHPLPRNSHEYRHPHPNYRGASASQQRDEQ